MTCLYSGLAPACSQKFTREHILRENIGGTLKSNKIICDSCNKRFGTQMDDALRILYLSVISSISPFLPSSIKDKTYFIPQNDGVNLVLRPGNQVNMEGIKVLDRPPVRVN